MIAWLPQASYPCGNFSDTPNLIIKGLNKFKILFYWLTIKTINLLFLIYLIIIRDR